MKKLMFAAAAIAAGVAVADVSSANIVGYMTLTSPASTNNIWGVPFMNCGDTSFSIQNIELGKGTAGKDTIKVYNSATASYATYYWWADIKIGGTKSGHQGWGDNKQNQLNCTITPSQGFWMKTSKTSTVNVSGQVASAADNTFNTSANVNDIVCAIYPTATDIQKITLDKGTAGKDTIKVYNPESASYSTYYWWADIKIGGAKSGHQGWGDNKQNQQAYTLQPAQGFWIKTSKANTVTVASPL